MKNTSNSNIKVKPPTMAERRREMNNSMLLFRDWPITKDHAMKMIEDLDLMFQEDPNMISLIAWRTKNGLTEKKVCELRDQYPEFADPYHEIKERIAWRRLDKAAERKHDAAITKYVMPYFSDTFKNLEEWRMKTKGETNNQNTTRIVVMSDIPTTDVVPPREEQE